MHDSNYISYYSSLFGDFTIVWQLAGNYPQVWRIFLSNEKYCSEELARRYFSNFIIKSNPFVDDLGYKIQQVIAGEYVTFNLEILAFERCGSFQQKVILAESAVPRGRVTTYSRLARYLGVNHAARAVGSALATNPFPIVIPCHRTVRADGSLGGYQGGQEMKRVLLTAEGVKIAENGKVVNPILIY